VIPDGGRFVYPVVLSVAGRRCLVVGGGAIAARKAEGLLHGDAHVTVVSPSLGPALLALAEAGRLRWIPREYHADDLAGAVLVMVATDRGEVNARVATDARAAGVWVNCADDPQHCDFILPAVIRRGALSVAVSSGGASPALTRMLRETLEPLVPADYAALTEVVAAVRRSLREAGRSPEPDRWRACLDGELRELVASGRTAEASDRLRERLGA
jgi:precorrin-2 dehydrogenase/sirohydrochlorin ferrochelatase